MKKPFTVRFDQALFACIHLLLVLSLLALPACRDGNAGCMPTPIAGMAWKAMHVPWERFHKKGAASLHLTRVRLGQAIPPGHLGTQTQHVQTARRSPALLHGPGGPEE